MFFILNFRISKSFIFLCAYWTTSKSVALPLKCGLLVKTGAESVSF
nr:MAG TPA_asm: hypothetical protein [Microviridae sp.]